MLIGYKAPLIYTRYELSITEGGSILISGGRAL